MLFQNSADTSDDYKQNSTPLSYLFYGPSPQSLISSISNQHDSSPCYYMNPNDNCQMNRSFSRKKTWFSLNQYNNLAIFVHFVNALIVFVLCFTYLNDKPDNILYVSGKVELTHTNYALIDVNTKKTCQSVRDYSSIYKDNILTQDHSSIQILKGDIMPHNLYDFTNKTWIKYNIPEYHIYTYYIIASFFTISFLFQAFNGIFVGFEGSFPRIMHYYEYSISSSLMIIVLAINTGITELYTLIAFFGLFFGMNVLGACAEIISWMTAILFQNRSMTFGWLLPHISAWFLFLFAYIPILTTYEKTRGCSAGSPDFVTAAIYVEFVFFCIFGLSQTYLLTWRSIDPTANVSFWIDFTSITLSIIAKTFLAWVLIGPVLSSL